GPAARPPAPAVVFEPDESARPRRRATTGTRLVAPIRSGARSENGFPAPRKQATAASPGS
ncbi:hypothetical protein, partial [Streptomyces sp. NPDC056358]|uniref:hypothetical protein n=1 Tax=Streptomyces sp. NPDC056358 TaxID=3345794 RepID=UPI0035DC7C2A